jgi:aminoglycoside phosphotransferase (APT) family kinase protein
MTEQETIVPGVTRAGLTALLERYQLGPLESVQPLDGVKNTLLLNRDLLLRYDTEPALLRKEALIYRRLTELGGVPCPELLALDIQADLLPVAAMILRHAPGVLASTVWPSLDSVQREQISEDLGRICGTIHSLRWSVYGAVLPDDAEVQSARWTDVVMRKAVRVYQQASQRDLLSRHVLDAFATTISDSDAIINTSEMPVLTHTDLGMWNVLLHPDGSRWQIAALLGWNAAIVADPAWEFAALWSMPLSMYPLPDSFMYGYKERHMPATDLRIRQRVYRTIYHLECALQIAAAPAPRRESESIAIHLTAIQRLLTPH